MPHLRHDELLGNALPVVQYCLIIILTYWRFLWISSSLWVCLFYRKALQWFARKVIFLVSLLQKSNKYKSNAIWVLPTFCFHFIVCFLHILFFFFSIKPQVHIFILVNVKQAATLPRISVPLLSGSCDARYLCSQWAESSLPSKIDIRAHCKLLAHLAEICTLTNWKLMDIHIQKYKASE